MSTTITTPLKETPLEIVRGDTQELTIVIKVDGSPLDITGGLVFLTVKSDVDFNDSQAEFQVRVDSHTDPSNGTTKVTLPTIETAKLTPGGEYYYDLRYVDPGGQPMTLERGQLRVLYNVTEATS